MKPYDVRIFSRFNYHATVCVIRVDAGSASAALKLARARTKRQGVPTTGLIFQASLAK